MSRLIFWGVLILVVLLIGLLIDQIFWRTIRLFLERPLAMRVRLIVLAVVVVTLVSSTLYGHYVTRLQLQVNEVSITSPRLPESFDGYRIAHLSDFHINSFDQEEGEVFIRQLIQEIRDHHVDVICFTGDLVTIRSAEAIRWRKALAEMAQQSGASIFAVLGNHDYADYSRSFTQEQRESDRLSLVNMIEEAGWHWLNNTAMVTQRNGESIQIVGVENIGEPPFSTYGDLPKAMQSLGGTASADSTYTVLLSHNPTHWRREVLPDTHIDLMLAGHTHAMQLRVFGWSPSVWTYPEYAGLYQEGDQYLYVNTGLGCTGPRVRIGVQPELTIITLQR